MMFRTFLRTQRYPLRVTSVAIAPHRHAALEIARQDVRPVPRAPGYGPLARRVVICEPVLRA